VLLNNNGFSDQGHRWSSELRTADELKRVKVVDSLIEPRLHIAPWLQRYMAIVLTCRIPLSGPGGYEITGGAAPRATLLLALVLVMVRGDGLSVLINNGDWSSGNLHSDWVPSPCGVGVLGIKRWMRRHLEHRVLKERLQEWKR
jgi:hypothetical protein